MVLEVAYNRGFKFKGLIMCLLQHDSTTQVDDFTAKLFGIYKQVQKEGRTQVRKLI